MPKVNKFAFNCHNFQLAATKDGFLIPGANGTLKASMIPPMDLNDSAGPYTLTVSSAGSLLFRGRVHVYWLNHSKEPEPFLGFKCSDTEAVSAALKAHNGETVLLEFKR